MTAMITGRNGVRHNLDKRAPEYPGRDDLNNGHSQGGLESAETLAERPDEENLAETEDGGLRPAAAAPAVNGNGHPARPQHALALLCYEDPASEIGRYVGKLAAALAERHIPLHLFSPMAFGLSAPGVHVHALGEPTEGGLLDRVQEFSRRASNAFFRQFPTGADPVTLLGFEWSTVPALSLLRGTRNVDFLLSLDSLERQRSDMGGETSRQIEEIERTGLREARAILLHRPAAADAARSLVPECAGRISLAPELFPVEPFALSLDPGAVKARYQVGPVDPTILYIGDMDERHGPDVLMKSVPAILKNHKQARFIFVGDGDLYWPLRVQARYLLLEHAVRLAGNVQGQELEELVRAADIIAVPSRENTEWWQIQAGWAAERPVVASHDIAGELLEHEQDCVRIYPNPSSCVWGIERVLYDAELGRAIGRKGRAKLEERFGWGNVATHVEGLIGVRAGEN
jgi:glycosyltransferase involved in cell wall biosynthesis